MNKHHEDFVRGDHDGTVYAEQHRPIPELRGGAYAVGFLYGYRRVERRPRD
jgi:hypothetical protein